MSTRLFLIAVAVLVAIVASGCNLSERLTGTKPPAVPCHGTSIQTDSLLLLKSHVCGTPRALE